MRLTSVRVMITGRVQGVWFRAWTEGEAHKLGLEGWVRNRSDSAVEALFHGPSDAVHRMVTACRTGPPAARVEDVAVMDAEAPEQPGFTLRPTK